MKSFIELNENVQVCKIGGICKAKDFKKQITQLKNNMRLER
jgi:hypothetical protein